MRFVAIAFLALLAIPSFGQNFYFTRQSSTDTMVAWAYINFPDNKLLKTKDNGLIITYRNWPPITTFEEARYFKIDTSGNIKWKKTNISDKIYETSEGNFVGTNLEYNTNLACGGGKVLNYYDSVMNLKWRRCYAPASTNNMIVSNDVFNYVGSINNKTHFRALFYDFNTPNSHAFVSGTIDTIGVTVTKNEPFIYTSDSLNNVLYNYHIYSDLIGHYGAQTYFLNYGNWFNGQWWSNNKRGYSFAYISSFDTVLNKYNYRDIKIDSLWAINGAVRISNNSFIIYGSRAYQPYLFKTDFNGTVYWAKKIKIPFADQNPLSFTDGVKFGADKIVLNFGANSYSDLFTYSTMVLDTTGNIVGTPMIASGDGKGNLYNIQNKIYSITNTCKSIQIFKGDVQNTTCGSGYNYTATVSDKIPVCHSLQLLSNTNYSFTVLNVTPNSYPVNSDNLIKTDGCVPFCGPQNIPINAVKKQTIKIYPNPFSNVITIESGTPYNVKLYNLDGKKLLDLDNMNSGPIELSALPNGIYFIIIENSEGRYKQRCIKKE